MKDYDEFYSLIWGYYLQPSDVSYDYRELHTDFIRNLTFGFYRDYEKNNVHISVYAKAMKTVFINLFLFSPETTDFGDSKDYNDI